MGGEGSMARWVKARPQLGGADLTHPTPAGHLKIAAVLPDWRAAQTQAREVLGAEGVQALRDASLNIWSAPV